ncbi:amidase [Roseateles sp.]|jgi:amidase|uniref:amidase n=1 Tax=Roseateles sp. TaxID=1971397 RepID=UPI0037C851EF
MPVCGFAESGYRPTLILWRFIGSLPARRYAAQARISTKQGAQMSSFAEYEEHDAIGLARLIHTRQVSASEVLEAAVERIEARNPTLNAVVTKTYELARTACLASVDGPLAGVPFLLKDLGVQLHGVRITNGSRFWKDQICSKDSTLVKRYKAAGLVIVGITSTAENGLSAETAPSLFGAVRNPWSLAHSAGGSSGGAAAAVSAGLVPAAHANDGGGSIRIPSSCCGVFGLKSSRGRNPVGPDIGENWNGLSIQNVISRSVRDSAALLDASHGPEAGDPYAAPAFRGSYLDGLAAPLRPLRVAFQTVTHFGQLIEPVVAQAVLEVARQLQALGHHVEEARPSFDAEALKQDMFTVVGCNAANAIRMREVALGRPATPDDIERITWHWIERCKSRSGRDMAQAIGTLHATARAFGRFFERYDVLLTPTMPHRPQPLLHLDMRSDDLDGYYDKLYHNNTFTTACNCTGIPAASLPLAWADGLPIGIQIAGPLGQEMRLLRLAAQLEEAHPWATRRPPMTCQQPPQ